MKTLNKTQWELYKGSQWYKDAVADFEQLEKANQQEAAKIFVKYNNSFLSNGSEKDVEMDFERLNRIIACMSNYTILTDEDIDEAFTMELSLWASSGECDDIDQFSQSAFKGFESAIRLFSIAFYQRYNDCYVPYLYAMQFDKLQAFADKYDIELPPIPKRAAYKDRCLYYLSINSLLQEFRRENKLSPAELCALLYDYEIRCAEPAEQDALQGNYHNIWILCGNKWGEEKIANDMFWQASEETRKGDVMLFYEKYPIKAITGIWQAQADGMADPFFHYYGFTYIGNEIQMPHITLDEMKADEHFKEVNFVRKNFQDVSGWQVTHKDYNLLLQMWAAKGVDTSTLPQPFIPPVNDWSKVLDKGKKIKEIADVEEHIIVPFLAGLGLERHKDYERQVTLHLGREDKGRTDFSLFPFGDNRKYARVVIEAKRKQDNKLQETFNQARSYADMQQADLLLIIDEQEVNAYSRCGKDNLLDFRNRQTFYWYDILNDADIHAQLRKMILTYK